MSDTTPAISTPVAAWGAPAVSLASMLIFAGAIAVVCLLKDVNPTLIALLGVAATNATTVVNFWVGSSSSSQAKDKTIASQAATALAGPIPVTLTAPKGTP